MLKIKSHLSLLFFIIILSACRDSTLPTQSFYYWKTVFQLKPSEQEFLTANKVNRLYIRYFDVIQDEGIPRPDATIIFKDSISAGMEVVPVVFIVNNVLAGLPVDSMAALAERIHTRIETINHKHRIVNVPEFQMDCDWNVSTRDKYFALLRAMHNRLHSADKQLSVTLRLHQLKYRKSSGVPPADKVTLMCYNMGHLTEYGSRNSILSVDEIRKYMQGSGVYPLPIDVAFPLFSWGVCFSNKQYRGLISGLSGADVRQPHFSEIAPNLFCADSTLVLRGAYIRKGDHIRLEEPSIEELNQAARVIASQIKTSGYIVWYHLDSLLLQKHPDHELQEIGSVFR